jgi:hypothetical protein
MHNGILEINIYDIEFCNSFLKSVLSEPKYLEVMRKICDAKYVPERYININVEMK